MIYVDSREPMKEFKEAFLYYVDHSKEGDKFPEIEFKALKYGDYLIKGKYHECIIERKEYHDYINSIGDYLKERLEHMRLEYENTMLLIEGNYVYYDQHNIYLDKGREGVQKGMKYQTARNFEFSQSLNGTMITRTKDYRETVLALICYWRYLESLPKIKNSYSAKGKFEKWLALCPFVGKNLAEKAQSLYPSCFDAILDISEWGTEKAIKGIMENWKE